MNMAIDARTSWLQRFARNAAAIFAFVAATAADVPTADAHPHVWISVKTEVIYDSDARVTGFRHHWVFDELYSAYALQGLDVNNDGEYSEDELKELAEINIESLGEFDYFTFPEIEGAKIALTDPIDYSVVRDDQGILTLHFTLPVKEPVKHGTLNLGFRVYDPTFFIAFSLAKETPISLGGVAREGCGVTIEGMKEENLENAQIPDDVVTNSDGTIDFGVQYAPLITVSCAGS